jgi:hypothetical protein
MKLPLTIGLATLSIVSAGMAQAQTLVTPVKSVNQAIADNPYANTVKTASVLQGEYNHHIRTTNGNNSGDVKIAQSDIEPGTANYSGGSYIGVAGNIGFTGGDALGRGNFAVISKIGLSKSISLRPAAIIGDETNFLVPITYDFSNISADPLQVLPFRPYLGAGIDISTAKNSDVGLLITGGVDVPISRGFIGNAGINASIKDKKTDVGLIIGVGYSFPGF